MKVRVILVDLNCIIEGESAIMGGGIEGDNLERKGLGFWVKDWTERRDFIDPAYIRKHTAAHHKSEVFVPWSSALYVERLEDKSAT